MIAIIGGGASGLLVAANLRRHFPRVAFRIFEPGGAAYSTAEPSHLLNVRANQMSAWVDRPDDFVQWAGVANDAFARRARYGAYLRSLAAHL